MRIDVPHSAQIPQLLRLWKTAFGDHGGFWEMFLDTAFLPAHCRCITEEGQVCAALYWFDCAIGEQKCAYIYAVATHPEHRGKGLCRALLEDTHAHLKRQGYASAVLVPEQPSLREMYEKLGYQTCTRVSQFSCGNDAPPLSLQAIGPGEYARLRRIMLPKGGVIQERENLPFLAAQAEFFSGSGCLLAAWREGDLLHVMELLGDRELAPGIVAGLNCRQGFFRCPGQELPFAMGYSLREDAKKPAYFGLAFD